VRYQRYSCGPAAIVNALRVLGRRVPERRIRPLCGTTEEHGTDEDGIKSCLTELGYSHHEFLTPSRKDGIIRLSGSLNEGPVIICVDSWQHWVVVIGRIGDRFILIDSTNTVRNKAENGVAVMGRRDLMKRWKHKEENAVYGILVTKKK
jgi:ABC-type bacteriocin/lantibiotic exporter with double-glycine peptidase domain